MDIPQKTRNRTIYSTDIPLLCIYPKDSTAEIAAHPYPLFSLFIAARKWNQPRHPSTNE